jgi:hypothetical protein
MDKMKRFYRLIELYLNDSNRESIEGFYGKGTVVKIKSISYSKKINIALVDAVIVLGELINEEVLETAPIELLIKESVKFFYPEYNVNTLISWDA